MHNNQKTQKLICLTGLPRSGSTLLSHMLAQHPDINSTASSPLSSIIQSARKHWSDEPFLLAQLDDDFDNMYDRLGRSIRAFIEEFIQSNAPITIDKSRGWLFISELLIDLFPDIKIIVTIRDLRYILNSIERKHKQTLLLDFPDHMEPNIRDARAHHLFTPQGVIGGPLKAIYNLDDIYPPIWDNVYIWRYEDLIASPQDVMDNLFEWIELEPVKINIDNVQSEITKESDSWYRMKYPHTIQPELNTDNQKNKMTLSHRIQNEVIKQHMWFYMKYYPEIAENYRQTKTSPQFNPRKKIEKTKPSKNNDDFTSHVADEDIKNILNNMGLPE